MSYLAILGAVALAAAAYGRLETGLSILAVVALAVASMALIVLVLSVLRLTPKWMPDALGALSEPRGPIEWVRKRLEQRSTAAV